MNKSPRILKQRPIHGTVVKLPDSLVKAWRHTVVALARPPKSLKPFRSEEQRFHAIAKAEAVSVQELWEIFTSDRERLGRYLMDANRQTVAYLLGFHLVNSARLWHGLSEANARHSWVSRMGAAKAPLRILDLGCGTGAMAQGLMEFLRPQGPVTIELVDKSRTFLTAAAKGIEDLGTSATVRTIRSPIEQYNIRPNGDEPDESITAILLGYVWNELALSPRGRQKVLSLVESYVTKRSLVAIVEPATEHLARGAMELRDTLVAAGYLPLYPCPHALPCPMLNRSRDWCYSEIRWHRPAEASALDSMTGLDRSYCHGAIYVLASPTALQAKASPTADKAGIIVGRPLLKGAIDGSFNYLVCSEAGTLENAKQSTGPILPRGARLVPPSPR